MCRRKKGNKLDKKSNIKTYSFILLAILFSKALGLVRSRCLAVFYSRGIEADAFTIASQIPLVFFDVTLGIAVASAFIPVLNGYLGEGKKKRAFRFVNVFLSVTLSMAAIMCLLLVLFSDQAAFLMASQSTKETLALASQLLKIVSPIVFIAVAAYSCVAVLQSLGEFRRPAIMSALSNLAMIAYFLLFNDRFGIQGLAVALVIGWLCQLLILIGPLRERGFKFRYVPRLHDEGMSEVGRLVIPVLLSSWAVPINKIMNNNFASTVAGGPVTMDYAYQLFFMVAGVFSMALTNLFFPRMSRNYAQGKEEENFQLLCDMLTNITMIVMPVLLFFMLFSKAIIRFVYEGGAFTAEDTAVTGVILTCYAAGMVGVSWQEILNKYFYSGHDGKSPLRVAIVGILVNVVAGYGLLQVLGLPGIAVAATISITFIGVVLFVMAWKKSGQPAMPFLKNLVKVAACSVLCGVLLMAGSALVGGFAQGNKIICLVKMGVVFGITSAIYYGALVALRTGQASVLLSLLRKKGTSI